MFSTLTARVLALEQTFLEGERMQGSSQRRERGFIKWETERGTARASHHEGLPDEHGLYKSGN